MVLTNIFQLESAGVMIVSIHNVGAKMQRAEVTCQRIPKE